MNHPWLIAYVAGVLGSIGFAFAGMMRALEKLWNTQCHCCNEKVALWSRL